MRKRLFDGKMPLTLRIVAWLFIVQGVFSLATSLIQTHAANVGLNPSGFGAATDILSGLIDPIVGAGILFRRRCWRSIAALGVGSNCGMQVAGIVAASGGDHLFYPQSIILLISLGFSCLVLWALTDRRAHLAMR